MNQGPGDPAPPVEVPQRDARAAARLDCRHPRQQTRGARARGARSQLVRIQIICHLIKKTRLQFAEHFAVLILGPGRASADH